MEAEIPLPELAAADPSGPADVRVLRSATPLGCAPTQESWLERSPEGDALSVFEGVGRYLVRGGREILIDPFPGADEALVRHLLLGPVLAQVLWQRDLFALHASVLRVRDRQLGFVGASGEGKSTTAFALQQHGHALLCDDVAALAWQTAPVQVRPGFPRMRLYPDVLGSLGEDPERLARVHADLDKRLAPARAFLTDILPLDAVYVLQGGQSPAAAPMSKREAMMELMRHTYYSEQFVALYGFRKHMQMAAKVAETVPVYQLRRPRDLARLPELVHYLEQHAADSRRT